MVVRDEGLSRSMSRYLVDRLERCPAVEVLTNSEVRVLEGDKGLERAEVENTKTGERRWIDARVLFVFIGAEPRTEWLRGAVELDSEGFVLTGPDAVRQLPCQDGSSRRARIFETTRPGVFAVGDARSGSVKRVASAVGEGSMVVRLIHEHLDDVVGPSDVRGTPINRPANPVDSTPSPS
jgi:thioredoxin reductase (NADPH)